MERWIPILSTLTHYGEIRELEERRFFLTRDSILYLALKKGQARRSGEAGREENLRVKHLQRKNDLAEVSKS